MLTLDRAQTGGHAAGHQAKRLVGSGDGAFPRGLNAVEAFAFATALGCGFAEPGGDESTFFEPGERRVQRAGGDGAAAARLDLLTDGDAVGVDTQPDQSEQDPLFEVTERVCYAITNTL